MKHAEITPIPQPEKPATPENLRPIPITSCVGKLYDHENINSVTANLRDYSLLPHIKSSLREQSPPQDDRLQLKDKVFAQLSSLTKRALLALGITGTFANVSLQAILEGLQLLIAARAYRSPYKSVLLTAQPPPTSALSDPSAFMPDRVVLPRDLSFTTLLL